MKSSFLLARGFAGATVTTTVPSMGSVGRLAFITTSTVTRSAVVATVVGWVRVDYGWKTVDVVP